MSEVKAYNFDFETSYNQFYLVGNKGDAIANPGEETFEYRLAIAKHSLSITTESYGHIRGDIHVLDKERMDVKLSEFDHIVEGGWVNESGKLVLLNCPESDIVLSIKVKSGKYKVRVYTFGVEEDMEDDFESTDRYLIEVWPSTDLKLKVLKQIR